MKVTHFMEYHLTICGALLPYLVNGDASGLEDWEIEAADRLAEMYPGAIYEPGEQEEFARCEVLGEHGSCIETKVYVPVPVINEEETTNG